MQFTRSTGQQKTEDREWMDIIGRAGPFRKVYPLMMHALCPFRTKKTDRRGRLDTTTIGTYVLPGFIFNCGALADIMPSGIYVTSTVYPLITNR